VGAKNWKRISIEFLDGRRSDVQCLHRWNKVLEPGLVNDVINKPAAIKSDEYASSGQKEQAHWLKDMSFLTENEKIKASIDCIGFQNFPNVSFEGNGVKDLKGNCKLILTKAGDKHRLLMVAEKRMKMIDVNESQSTTTVSGNRGSCGYRVWWALGGCCCCCDPFGPNGGLGGTMFGRCLPCFASPDNYKGSTKSFVASYTASRENGVEFVSASVEDQVVYANYKSLSNTEVELMQRTLEASMNIEHKKPWNCCKWCCLPSCCCKIRCCKIPCCKIPCCKKPSSQKIERHESVAIDKSDTTVSHDTLLHNITVTENQAQITLEDGKPYTKSTTAKSLACVFMTMASPEVGGFIKFVALVQPDVSASQVSKFVGALSCLTDADRVMKRQHWPGDKTQAADLFDFQLTPILVKMLAAPENVDEDDAADPADGDA